MSLRTNVQVWARELHPGPGARLQALLPCEGPPQASVSLQVTRGGRPQKTCNAFHQNGISNEKQLTKPFILRSWGTRRSGLHIRWRLQPPPGKGAYALFLINNIFRLVFVVLSLMCVSSTMLSLPDQTHTQMTVASRACGPPRVQSGSSRLSTCWRRAWKCEGLSWWAWGRLLTTDFKAGEGNWGRFEKGRLSHNFERPWKSK